MRILIIDDDTADRMAVCRFLKSSGDRLLAEEATNADQGLKMLQNQVYDCVFLDYFLPDSDGLTVLKKARTIGVQVPIVMLTGHGDERLAVQMIHAGASDYLPKDQMSQETLSHCLRQAMRLSEIEKEKLKAEKDLLESNKKISDILESISDAFFAVDTDWRITYLNTQAEDLLQIDRKKVLNDRIWDHLIELVPWFKDSLTKAMVLKIPISTEGHYAPLHKWIEVQVYPGQDGISVYFRDITKRKQAEEKMSYLANYDALTGLPNRTLFIDRLNQAFSRAPWRNRVLALMFCDLDRFKVVNDTLGHNVGDLLLKVAAERYKHCLRPGDTVARLGGDEFVILLNDMARSEDIKGVALKILKEFSSPIMLEEQEIFITTSIGISLFPFDCQDTDAMLKHADLAMYRAKEQGKNNYQIYSPSMDNKISKGLIMESALRRALKREELLVYYQPMVDLKTKRIVAAEALVRWQHPELGMIPPGDFLPLAKETGLIVPIDQWVMHTACAQNKTWHRAGYTPLRISVNLSNRQFKQEDLITSINEILKDTGLEADYLELELTEEIIMQDLNSSMTTLEHLRNMGITLAIDDFGTGYSSLSHLKKFPIHTIKIDRSFIGHICENSCDAAITEAIIAMAKKLNLSIVAEGVETREQQEFLIQHGCEFVQGFFFSRPLPAEDFTLLLKENGSIV